MVYHQYVLFITSWFDIITVLPDQQKLLPLSAPGQQDIRNSEITTLPLKHFIKTSHA